MSNKKVILFAFLLLTSLQTSNTSFTSDPTEYKLDGPSASTEPNLQVLEPKKTLSGWIDSSETAGLEKNSVERNLFHELDMTAFPYFEKEYSNLPSHDRIAFSLILDSRVNITLSESKLHLLFDSREAETVEYSNHSNYYNDDSSITEDRYPFEIQGIITHNISSLRVELAPKFTQNIHHIIYASLRMAFILDPAWTEKLPNTLPDVSSSSANNIVAITMSESFALFQEESHPKRILQSIVCDNTCLTCDGAGANDCTSCSSDRYLTVLGPTVIYCAPDEYSDFGDFCEYMLLAPPDNAGKATLTVLIYIMQYLQYLDLPTMPANMERIAVGKGRSILSLLYGFQMPSKMQDSFIKYPLNEIFERRSLHSSFLVNFWPEITSFLIIIVAAIVFTFCEKITKRYKWGKWQAAFEAVRVITRWNLCLMILATSFGNMILYASLEFRTFYISFGSSSTYASFFICLISIAFITGMFIGTIYLVRKAHNARKVSYDNYIIFAKTWQDFQVLFSGYSSRYLISRMFFLVYTIRLGLPMLVAAYIYPSPLAQAIIQLLISIAIVAIILYYKPIRRKINKIQIIMYEGLVLITNIMGLALTVVSIHHSENTNALNGLGYFIIFINFLINLLLLIFLLIKVVIAVKTILSLKNMQSAEEKIISWLQILYLPLQQGGMTFECVYQELDLVNEPIEDTSTMNSSRKNRTGHNTSYDRNNRSVDNSMMTLFDKKGNKKGRYGNQSPRSRVTPSNNITSTSNRGPGKPVSPSRVTKPAPLKRNNSPYKISNDPHLQENNLTISPRYSPTRKDGVLFSGERNGMSYNEWVAARSDPNYKKPASPVANKSNVTRTPSPGNTRNQTPIKPRSPNNIRQPSPQSPSRANKSGPKSPNKVVPWR